MRINANKISYICHEDGQHQHKDQENDGGFRYFHRGDNIIARSCNFILKKSGNRAFSCFCAAATCSDSGKRTGCRLFTWKPVNIPGDIQCPRRRASWGRRSGDLEDRLGIISYRVCQATANNERNSEIRGHREETSSVERVMRMMHPNEARLIRRRSKKINDPGLRSISLRCHLFILLFMSLGFEL